MNSFDILFVFRHSPYGNSIAREGLEAALAAGAFDQNIAILFIDDGVWQLKSNQDSSYVNRKSHQKMTSALPLFGVDALFAHSISLENRNLSTEDTFTDAQLVNTQQTQQIMNNAKSILSF